MPSKDDELLEHAIKNVSKRRHVLSDGAKKARHDYDDLSERASFEPMDNDSLPAVDTVSEFNESVRILISIFEASKFDELAIFISYPSRILILNLFIGILRGMGFFIGFGLVGFIVLYLFKTSIPSFSEYLSLFFNSLPRP